MEEDLLMVRVAELYYDEDKTQDEIGGLLKISRWKVGRLLTQARERGIVRIEIVHPRARRLGLERLLVDRFGLTMPSSCRRPTAMTAHSSASRKAAADFLTALRPVPRTLGVSWGRTLRAVAEALPDGWANGVTVVQLNGGVSLNRRSGGAAGLAVTIAQRASGQVSPASEPRDPRARGDEAGDRVRPHGRRGARRSRGGAGVPVHRRTLRCLFRSRRETDTSAPRTWKSSRVVARSETFSGAMSTPRATSSTRSSMRERSASRSTACAEPPRAIFVTAGPAKHDIARTVVTSGLCGVLVTDETTARALLEEQ